MRPVQRAVEQLCRIRIDTRSVDLDAPKKFIPLVERRLTDSSKIKVRDLRLCIRARLIGGDERHTHSCKDGRGALIGLWREGEERAELFDEA